MNANKNIALTLSIIIPAFNEENYIENCLAAIARQSVLPDEVIVVDNNSTDDTAKLAESFPFVTLIKEKQQGIVFARNTGFNAATSDIIARIDADTLIAPDWVSTVKQKAQILGQHGAYTGPCSFRDWEGKMILFWGHRLLYFWSSRIFLGHKTLFGSNMFIMRDTWSVICSDTCTRTDVHEDMDLSVHVNQIGGKVHFSSDLRASVSPRRIFRMWHYPKMWFKTKIIPHQESAAIQAAPSWVDQ